MQQRRIAVLDEAESGRGEARVGIQCERRPRGEATRSCARRARSGVRRRVGGTRGGDRAGQRSETEACDPSLGGLKAAVERSGAGQGRGNSLTKSDRGCSVTRCRRAGTVARRTSIPERGGRGAADRRARGGASRAYPGGDRRQDGTDLTSETVERSGTEVLESRERSVEVVAVVAVDRRAHAMRSTTAVTSLTA